ncbi:MAG: hypothetical protein RXN93_06755 [Thermocladium sp.]
MRAGLVAFIAALIAGSSLLLANYLEPIIVTVESSYIHSGEFVSSSLLGQVVINAASGSASITLTPLFFELRMTSLLLDVIGLSLSVYLYSYIRRKSSWSSVVDKMRDQPLLLMPIILVASAVVLLIPMPVTVAASSGSITILTNIYFVSSGLLYFAGVALAVILIRFYGYGYDISYSVFNFDMLDSATIYVDQLDETLAA